METRPFGRTGESFPILSFGAQRVVDEEGCNEDQALAILNTALDRGIRYFDTAWAYSKGQSEERVGLVAKHRRDEMWIATKTVETRRDGARRQLEESLTRLQTDRVDEWRLHNVYSFDRLDQMTARSRSRLCTASPSTRCWWPSRYWTISSTVSLKSFFR
jgi:hypothetical protein